MRKSKGKAGAASSLGTVNATLHPKLNSQKGRWTRRALGLAWSNKAPMAGSAFAWLLGAEILNLIAGRILGPHFASTGFLLAFLLWPAMALAGSRAFVDASKGKPVFFADFWTGVGLRNVGRSLMLGVINLVLGVLAFAPLLIALVDMSVGENATVQQAEMAFIAPKHLALVVAGVIGTWILASVFWGLVWRAPARLARGMTLFNALKGSIQGFWHKKGATFAATGGLFGAVALCWLGMVAVLMLALVLRQHLGTTPVAGGVAANAGGLVGAGAAIVLFVAQIGVFFSSFWILSAMWGAPALAEEEHAEIVGEEIPTALPTP